MTAAPKPVVEVKVNNPVTYLKNWWNKIVEKEGVDFRFHIRPLTAICMTVVVASLGFGLGRFVIPPGVNIPFFKFTTPESPTPTPTSEETFKETAYTGTLQFSEATQKFYLTTSTASEAITLAVPDNIDLLKYVGKRILAMGKYNKTTRVLTVTDAKSLEVLPKSLVPIPTSSPSPTPTAEPIMTPTPEIFPSSELNN